MLRPALLLPLLQCLALPLSAAPTPAITVDGRPDEPAWAGAEVFHDFVVTEPYTLASPAHQTEARLLATPEGIAIAFRVTQPAGVARLRERTPRDADMPGDRVNVFIDFDGDRKVAYNFTVGLSGALQDATWTNEVAYSPDWDGDWRAAVAEDDSGWSAEFLLPWSIAPMAGSDAPRRTVAVLFDRVLGATGERSASAPASFIRPRFVSDFPRVELDQYQSAVLDVFPYATASHDLLDAGTEGKAGLDVFWKPSGDFQLTAALNPDFGQVEADELVVNFDAVETFFSDKRPFFTENQSQFDLRTPDEGQLVYTRRIGGPRDDDQCARRRHRRGAQGRRQRARLALGHPGGGRIRLRRRARAACSSRSACSARARPSASAGSAPGRIVRSSPREAAVNAIDATWRAGRPACCSAGQAIHTAVDANGTARDGLGAWLRLDLTPSTALRHQLEMTHFDAALDFNDMGFQRRASLNELEWTEVLQQSGFAPDHWLRGSAGMARSSTAATTAATACRSMLIPELTLQHADGGETLLGLYLESSGFDDLISRGNGLFRRDAEASLSRSNTRPRDAATGSSSAFVNAFEATPGDDGRYWGGAATWFASERLTVGRSRAGWPATPGSSGSATPCSASSSASRPSSSSTPTGSRPTPTSCA